MSRGEYEVRWGRFVHSETEKRYLLERLEALKQGACYQHLAIAAIMALAATLDFSLLQANARSHVLWVRALLIATQLAALFVLRRDGQSDLRRHEVIYTVAMGVVVIGYSEIAVTYLQETGRSDYPLMLGLGGVALLGLHPATGRRIWPSALALSAALAWVASAEFHLGTDPFRSAFTVGALNLAGAAVNLSVHSRGRVGFAATERLSRAEAELTRITLADAQATRGKLAQRNDEWQAVMDSGQLLVLLVKRSGVVAFANDLAVAAGVHCGDDFDAWLHTNADEPMTRPFADVFSDGRARDLETVCTVHGTPRTFALRAAAVGRRSPVEEISIIGLDTTEFKKLANALLQTQRNQVVGALVGGITHDFNNLLMVIIGSAEVLRTGNLPESEQRQFLTDLLEASASAARLTRQLLLFSRRQPTRAVPVQLNELISDVARLLRRMVGKRVEVQLHLCQSPLWVRADPSHLEQLLMNLAVNARDAMPSGGTLRIQTRVSPAGTQSGAQLDVSDDGEGIAAEILPRIFDPLFTTKSRSQGTGLGLSTVKGVVEQLGGSIEVHSTPGQGTQFTTWLPLTSAGQCPSAKPTTAQPVRRTVLLVDDNLAVLKTTRAMLQRQNYEVLVASESSQALELATRHPSLDLLLTDVHLPGEGGIQLAAAVRTQVPGTSVVFMSGYVEDREFLQEVAAGRHRLLDKPFSGPQLYDTLEAAFGEPQHIEPGSV